MYELKRPTGQSCKLAENNILSHNITVKQTTPSILLLKQPNHSSNIITYQKNLKGCEGV